MNYRGIVKEQDIRYQISDIRSQKSEFLLHNQLSPELNILNSHLHNVYA